MNIFIWLTIIFAVLEFVFILSGLSTDSRHKPMWQPWQDWAVLICFLCCCVSNVLYFVTK